MSSPIYNKDLPVTHKSVLDNEDIERIATLISFGVGSIYKSYRCLRLAHYWKLSICQNVLGEGFSAIVSFEKGVSAGGVFVKHYKDIINGCVFTIEIEDAYADNLEQYGGHFIEEFSSTYNSEISSLLFCSEREQYKAQLDASQLLLSLSSIIFEEGVMDNFLYQLVQELQKKMDGTICSMSVVKWSIEQETFEMPAVYEKGKISLGNDKFPLDVLKHRPIYRVIHTNKPLIMSKSQNKAMLESVNVHTFEEAATIIFPMDLGIESGAVSISSKHIESFSCIDLALVSSAVKSLATIYRQNIIQSKMFKQANYDQLTSLANRAYFKRFLAGLDLAADESASLLYIDLDKFKNVNDGYGHDVGDKYLQVVAKRIADQLRDNDLAARIGGDEFAVVLTKLNSDEDSERVAKRILNAFQRPIDIEGIDHDAGVSIGICDFNYTCDVSLALVQADKAMYDAKKAGRGCMVKYSDD